MTTTLHPTDDTDTEQRTADEADTEQTDTDERAAADESPVVLGQIIELLPLQVAQHPDTSATPAATCPP